MITISMITVQSIPTIAPNMATSLIIVLSQLPTQNIYIQYKVLFLMLYSYTATHIGVWLCSYVYSWLQDDVAKLRTDKLHMSFYAIVINLCNPSNILYNKSYYFPVKPYIKGFYCTIS